MNTTGTRISSATKLSTRIFTETVAQSGGRHINIALKKFTTTKVKQSKQITVHSNIADRNEIQLVSDQFSVIQVKDDFLGYMFNKKIVEVKYMVAMNL